VTNRTPFPIARRQTSEGFTLIEVCVAMIIVSIAALAAGQLSGVSLQAVVSARHQTSATYLAVQKLEQLRALTWRFDEQAVLQPASDATTAVESAMPAAGGRGLQPSPPNSMSLNTGGYVDFLDERGQWVGTGSTAPAAAVFIRRWNVRPLTLRPADALVLSVLVTTIRRESQATTGTPRRRLADDALVTTVMTRKVR